MGVLQAVANLLLTDCIGDLGSATKEIKVPANGTSAGVASTTTTEGVIVELVLVVIELVT